jgi:opine dehydrogenase
VNTRWLTEDVPFGLATWSALGASAGVAAPVMEALITLASAVLGIDFRSSSRSLAELGLAGLTPSEMLSLVGQ